ncbi:MAG: response regulator, partial [Bacteroidales bacterium]|nr:response regulator [Bacteroidales bacterium]
MKKYSPKILIVDDDKLYLKQFSAILSKEIQAKYYFSYSAKDAIELINKNSFAIILLDVNIPEKNGFELAKDVRNSKLNKHTPIIFITGISIDDQSVFEGYKAGAVDYLSKPINKFILFSKIKTFLELDLQKNELLNTRDKLKRINESLEKQVDQRTLQLKKELDRNINANRELQVIANQLRENYLFLETLIETMPNPIYYKNEKGEYLGCNKAFEEFQSAKKVDIIGKTIYNLTLKEYADKITKIDKEILKSGEKQNIEIKANKPDGSIRNLILYKNQFQVAHTGKFGIVGTIVDITDLTKAKGFLKIQHTIDYLSSLEK